MGDLVVANGMERDVPSTVSELLAVSLVIAIGFLLAVAFYESLSTRDVLVGRTSRLARRLTSRRSVRGVVYLLTVGVGIPVLVVVWTLVLEFALFVVSSVDRLGSLNVVAVSVVAAARILAYARQKTAHELAKAIPLALAFLFLTGGATNLEEKLRLVADREDGLALTNEMILFLIALELGLRILTDATHAGLAAIRSRRGVESDLGAWRTLWAAVRRPVTSVAPAPAPDRGDPAG